MRRSVLSGKAKNTAGGINLTESSKMIGNKRALPTTVTDAKSVLLDARNANGGIEASMRAPDVFVNGDLISLSRSQKKVIDAVMARKSVFFTGAAGNSYSFNHYDITKLLYRH